MKLRVEYKTGVQTTGFLGESAWLSDCIAGVEPDEIDYDPTSRTLKVFMTAERKHLSAVYHDVMRFTLLAK
jgi:hypothetical protein